MKREYNSKRDMREKFLRKKTTGTTYAFSIIVRFDEIMNEPIQNKYPISLNENISRVGLKLVPGQDIFGTIMWGRGRQLFLPTLSWTKTFFDFKTVRQRLVTPMFQGQELF